METKRTSLPSSVGEFSVIERCRGCHAMSHAFESVLEMDPMPLAGQFCETSDGAEKAATFPLTWVFCHRCGLVQVAEDVSDRHLFESYNYASSTVPGLVRHFSSYAASLVDRFGSSGPISFLEIGCNDGVLLNQLPSSWRLTGVDPSDVAERAVRSNSSYDLQSAPFSMELVRERGWVEAWDLISGSNCLAHISDLRDIFAGVHLALKPQGWFWVEVHDLEALLNGSQWDTIYHEHKVEWSVEALKNCVELLGFELRLTERVPLHGGVLRCGFQKSSRTSRSSPKEARMPEGLQRLRLAYEQRRAVPAVDCLLKALEEGQSVAAYGASGRANVYLNQMPELTFSFIIDEAPLRVNRFIPVVGTPIVPPSRLVELQTSHCLVTAWNYRDDIVAKNKVYQGRWLSAFPVQE